MQKVETFPLVGQLFRQKLCDSRHIYTDGTVQSFNLIVVGCFCLGRRLYLLTCLTISEPDAAGRATHIINQ
jgi:hypothetical protein